MRKLWRVRKDGIRQRYWVKSKKEKAATKRRARERRKKEAKEEFVDIKKGMMDGFYGWAIGQKTITRNMMSTLQRGKVHDEGDGVYQLNSARTPTAKAKSFKLRYDSKQNRLEIFLRGWHKDISEGVA